MHTTGFPPFVTAVTRLLLGRLPFVPSLAALRPSAAICCLVFSMRRTHSRRMVTRACNQFDTVRLSQSGETEQPMLQVSGRRHFDDGLPDRLAPQTCMLQCTPGIV